MATLRYPWERLEQLIGDRMGSRLAIAQRCAQRYRPTAWFWCRSNSRLTNNHAPRTIGDRFSGRPNERPTTCSSAVCRARLFLSPQRIKHGSSATLRPSGRQPNHRWICRPTAKAAALKTGTSPRSHPRTAPEGTNLPRCRAPLSGAPRIVRCPSTLHSFVKVRAKHRKRSQFELPPMELAATEVSPLLDRVAALKARTTVRNGKPARFVFSENEPLTLTSDGGEQ